ncbi:OmpA family protein [Flavobacterium taihuense]|uniref:OmpA family protein n=1 Tax=Flavobacterium taihuense TaxID=2857508 RepID=A0ABS6XTF4_9FLAO|nr:OmpA family protein [Flavobacterium taihuense]MBW4359952.1 OmpA family protein [Flavobacterium taihuense]
MKFLITLLFSFTVSCVFAQEQISFFFDSDKFVLQKNELLKLNQWLVANKEVKVVGAYGFCDEEGSVGYNDTLAKKRIDYVFNAIKNKVKIREDFKTRNFGELHTSSAIKAENRKVTLYYILPKDFVNEEKIIGFRKAVVVEKKKPNIKFSDIYIYENPDGSTANIKVDTVFMKKVSVANVGEKIKLESMNFFVDTFAIMPQSRSVMFELLAVMKSCPNLKIQIQGHICCVQKDVRDLSTQRAKAICKFLEYNGIEKSRMTFVGYGSTKPLYPLPEKTEAEREANRRVEIEIVAN